VLAEQTAGIPDDEKRKMLCDNAVKFFHLDR
jgi:predicted TIM-barrel fold metal-dependent hydrolase